MLKQLVFCTTLLVSAAALAQTPTPGEPPGGAMTPPTSTGPTPAPGPTPPAAIAPEQPAGHVASTSAPDVSAADKKFVTKLASANTAEIQAAQLAPQKSSDPKLKDIAQTILTDHTAAGQKLTTLAQQKGLKIPTALDAKDQKEIDKFNTLSGKKFDRAYVKDEIKDHKAALALLKNESLHGQDADIKALADELTPTIQKHLDMLQNTSS